MAGPIKVGIIGVHSDKGWASMAHVPALAQLSEFQLVAISHHQPEVARAAATKFNVPIAMDSAEDLVRHPDVELVVVAVKVPRHRPLVEAALTAGKAVLCEWPLGTDLDEALAMRDLAAAKGVRGFIGTQTRAAPAFNFVRQLLEEDYVGRVISSTLVGSGILWGDTLPADYLYTLDPTNGAGMVNVPFGHSLDAVLYTLKSSFAEFTAKTATVRQTVSIEGSSREVPLGTPDQVAIAGLLHNGVFLTAHFRGGMSKATNFHWEINGTRGDLVVTSPVGYTGLGGFRIQGATGEEPMHDLDVPGDYDVGLAPGITQSVALAYMRLASDIRSGTRLSPTFDDAVELHRVIAAVERGGSAGRHP